MSFESELAEQKRNELTLAAYLCRQKKALLYPNGNGLDSAKDFKLFVPQNVEVKWDKKAEQTGNLYIEIFNTKSGKPSGIAATKADVVYHFVPPNRLFNYCPKYFLGALENLKSKGLAIEVDGGDDNSRGIIVPIGTALQTGQLEEEAISL